MLGRRSQDKSRPARLPQRGAASVLLVPHPDYACLQPSQLSDLQWLELQNQRGNGMAKRYSPKPGPNLGPIDRWYQTMASSTAAGVTSPAIARLSPCCATGTNCKVIWSLSNGLF